MEKFRQIIPVQQRIVTLSMKPEIYQEREKSKNKKLLTLDRLSSILEPMNKHINLIFQNIAHQLLQGIVVRKSNHLSLIKNIQI